MRGRKYVKIEILTLFPDMCDSVLSESIIGRAREAGYVEIHCTNIRDYSTDKHNHVDDTPYGGGTGMIMQAQPIYDAYMDLTDNGKTDYHLIYMTPQGKPLTQARVKELAQYDRIAILCGHYEGVDERVIEELAPEEISIGDFVVTGGELPALVLTDAVCRMLPGVLRNEEAFEKESHFDGLLEYPQYTRPPVWKGREVPEVLLSGHHENIAKWQEEQAISRTKSKRQDMYEVFVQNDKKN
jgi:tRNA (guanine37-N1)-methyltransferase